MLTHTHTFFENTDVPCMNLLTHSQWDDIVHHNDCTVFFCLNAYVHAEATSQAYRSTRMD